MTKITSQGEAFPIMSLGGRAENVINAPAFGSVPAAGNFQSGIYVADGLYNMIVALQSTQAGALNVQRYIDDAGLVPIGPVDTIALTANALKVLKINDSVPFGSFTIQVTNTGGSPATITNFAFRATSN